DRTGSARRENSRTGSRRTVRPARERLFQRVQIRSGNLIDVSIARPHSYRRRSRQLRQTHSEFVETAAGRRTEAITWPISSMSSKAASRRPLSLSKPPAGKKIRLKKTLPQRANR